MLLSALECLYHNLALIRVCNKFISRSNEGTHFLETHSKNSPLLYCSHKELSRGCQWLYLPIPRPFQSHVGTLSQIDTQLLPSTSGLMRYH